MKKLFKIKNRRWSVSTTKAGTEQLTMDGQPCLAQIFLKTRNVFIDEDLLQDPEEFYDTLVHELTHCHLYSYGIDKRTFRDEEFICEFMAIYGAQIIDLARELMRCFINSEN